MEARMHRYTTDAIEAASKHVFHQPITIWECTCDECGMQFHGGDDMDCPLCGCISAKAINPINHTILIHANNGYVEVE